MYILVYIYDSYRLRHSLTRIYTYTHTHVLLCRYACIHVFYIYHTGRLWHSPTRIYTYTYTHIHFCRYTCIHVCIYISYRSPAAFPPTYIHIYIYAYTLMRIYIYIYIYEYIMQVACGISAMEWPSGRARVDAGDEAYGKPMFAPLNRYHMSYIHIEIYVHNVCIYVYTHRHAYTYTYTYTQIRIYMRTHL